MEAIAPADLTAEQQATEDEAFANAMLGIERMREDGREIIKGDSVRAARVADALSAKYSASELSQIVMGQMAVALEAIEHAAKMAFGDGMQTGARTIVDALAEKEIDAMTILGIEDGPGEAGEDPA
jgi:hypothetical protein